MEATFEKLKAEFIFNFIEDDRWKYLWTGFKNTLTITFFALCIGTVIGVVISIVRSTYDQHVKEMRLLPRLILGFFNVICKIYLTVIRGTPVVVQLLIIYFLVFTTSNNGVMIASLAFGINSGAYVAEIFRSGIMSVDRGQFEAGRSLGFNYVSTMWHIIIPQAFKNVLPTLANEFIVLLKETAIAGYVAVIELTKGGNIIIGRTYSYFMPLTAVALIYLILVMFFTWLVGILERRLRNSER